MPKRRKALCQSGSSSQWIATVQTLAAVRDGIEFSLPQVQSTWGSNRQCRVHYSGGCWWYPLGYTHNCSSVSLQKFDDQILKQLTSWCQIPLRCASYSYETDLFRYLYRVFLWSSFIRGMPSTRFSTARIPIGSPEVGLANHPVLVHTLSLPPAWWACDLASLPLHCTGLRICCLQIRTTSSLASRMSLQARTRPRGPTKVLPSYWEAHHHQ